MSAGILSTAYALPTQRQSFADGISLGIESACTGRVSQAIHLALTASQTALEKANLKPKNLDVIVDYTVLPQAYQVPAWNMSNQLQHELNATKAFTLGFSGGGTTNFQTALNFATALIEQDEAVNTALLVAADVAILNNRVINPDNPITILGDGATAVIVQGGAESQVVVETLLHSVGELHDVCYIPAGSLLHANHPNQYQLQINPHKYNPSTHFAKLHQLTLDLLTKHNLTLSDITHVVYPNLSRPDQNQLIQTFSFTPDQLCLSTLAQHGHMQANDLVLNYQTLLETSKPRPGTHLLILSHGLGFLYGTTLIRL